MKSQTANQGFSTMDLVIVIATIAVIAGVAWPMMKRNRVRPRTPGLACFSNVRQVGIGIMMWASDNDNMLPNLNETNQAWQAFQPLKPYIGSPKLLLCPEDQSLNNRKVALDLNDPPGSGSFSDPAFQNAALSYFYGVDSSLGTSMFLAGDRYLSTNAAITSGILTLNTNTQWAKGIHNGAGNIAFADGSARKLTTAQLLALVQTGTNGTQRLLIP